MDFNARSAWVYRNSTPDVAKAKRYGVWYVYVDPLSTNAHDAVAALHAAGLLPGAYFSKSWADGKTALEAADWCSSLLNGLLPRVGTAEAPPAMLDLETTDAAWVADFLARYRAHQPHRPTSYTNAPFQGAHVPYAALKAYAMPFYVQLYYGSMAPADAARAVLEAARGYGDASQVHPFYDGARWSTDQTDGCQFTLERLP